MRMKLYWRRRIRRSVFSNLNSRRRKIWLNKLKAIRRTIVIKLKK